MVLFSIIINGEYKMDLSKIDMKLLKTFQYDKLSYGNEREV